MGRIGVRTDYIGVPQGSPLAPVVWIVWMPLPLEEMERRVRTETNTDTELLSYVDVIHPGIYDWSGRAAGIGVMGEGHNEEELLSRVSVIIKEVANEYNLPLEDLKEGSLILRPRNQRKGGKESKWVKWLDCPQQKLGI